MDSEWPHGAHLRMGFDEDGELSVSPFHSSLGGMHWVVTTSATGSSIFLNGHLVANDLVFASNTGPQ